MSIQTSTLRPGLLVSLKTTVRGNVSYRKRDIEREHSNDDGATVAKWETERTISDPVEHEAAAKVRSKAWSLISGVCAQSAFGLLCPENSVDKLEEAIAEARKLADAFNAKATLSRIDVHVITGRIAPDDVEAVRAINSEVRDLLANMQSGIDRIDVKAVRDAANRARKLGSMLSPEAEGRIKVAIDAARGAARKIVKAGDQAAQEIDKVAIRKINDMRTAFLDLDDGQEVAAPKAEGRALDFEPAPSIAPVKAQAARPAYELE